MQSTPTPISLVSNDDPPMYYMVEITQRFCTHCHTTHELSDPYSVHLITNGKHKRPIKHMDEVRYNLPVVVQRLNPYPIPFCQDCAKQDMFSHLPRAPKVTIAKVAPSWVGANKAEDYTIAGTIKRKEPKPKAAPRSKTLTIDDVD
jgi:hypothetical protein